MCVTCLCDCLYSIRCLLFKFYTPLLLADLAITIYIVYQLFVENVFACCSYSGSALYNDCKYDTIGGANNVGVNDNGFCYRKDDGFNCTGSLPSCAQTNGVNITDLCSQSVLNDVAKTSWEWLTGVLIIKCVGILFLLGLEIKATCFDRKESGEEEAKSTQNCCTRCTTTCCCNLLVLLLRVFFLIFGTVITFLALQLLRLTDRVSFSSCDVLSSSLQSECNTVQQDCSLGDLNFYNVVFLNLSITGPYWADLTISILTGVIWLARLAVMRYYLSQAHLTDV